MARQQDGYVLLLTLVFLVVITLAVGYFTHKVDAARTLVAATRDKADNELAMRSALSDMLFRLAVTQSTARGIGKPPRVVRVDNRPYVAGPLRIRVMDARGLMNLRYFSRIRLDRFLGQHGVPVANQPKLYDALKDYIDADNLRRINGAERPQYKASGMPGPANSPLRDVTELRRVYGWKQTNRIVNHPKVMQLFTVMPAIGIDPNAAPPAVLTTLPGIDLPTANKLVRYREDNPIGYGVMTNITGLTPSQMQRRVLPYPSHSFRITIACASCSQSAVQYNLTLSPNSDLGPWRFVSTRRQNIGQPPSHTTPLPKLTKGKPASSDAIKP